MAETTQRITRMQADLEPGKDTLVRSFITVELIDDTGKRWPDAQPDFTFSLTEETRAETFGGETVGAIFDKAGAYVLSRWAADKEAAAKAAAAEQPKAEAGPT